MKSREAIANEATRKWVYERFGMADTEPKVRTEPDNGASTETQGENVQIVHPCTPEGYDGPTAPDGWPIGSVLQKVWA